MERKLCMGCMKEKVDGKYCENCGFSEDTYRVPPNCLPLYTILNGRYLVGKVIGEGNFEITYLGWDSSFKRKVVIKEYYPVSLVTRTCSKSLCVNLLNEHYAEGYINGINQFWDAARNTDTFRNTSGYAVTKDLFQENQTAYVVTPYIEKEALQTEKKVDQKKRLYGLIGALAGALLLLVIGVVTIVNRPDRTVEESSSDYAADRQSDTVNNATAADRVENTAAEEMVMETYENKNDFFRLEYPKGYQVKETSGGQVIISESDDFRMQFSAEYTMSTATDIAIYNAGDYASLIEEDESVMKSRIGSDAAQLSELSTGKLNGRDCYTLSFRLTIHDEECYGEVYFMDAEGEYGVYSLMWMVYTEDEKAEQYQSVCREIAESFEITGKAFVEDYHVHVSDNQDFKLLLNDSRVSKIEMDKADEIKIYPVDGVYSEASIWMKKSGYREEKPVETVLQSLCSYYFTYKDDCSYTSSIGTAACGRYDYAGINLSYRDGSKDYATSMFVVVLDGSYWRMEMKSIEEYQEITQKCFEDVLWSLCYAGESGELVYGNGSTGDSSVSSESSDKSSSENNYNIAEGLDLHASEGFAIMDTAHFELYIPNSGDWGYEVINNDAILFYYKSAKESGNGGTLVTIKAYDLNDNSYQEIPHYSVAGIGKTKKYIAIYPTDVQYDSSQQADYQKLFDYFLRMDSNNENNPFHCWDLT